MISLTIERPDLLIAARQSAAVKDNRDYLISVRIEVYQHHWLAIATNGAMMLIARGEGGHEGGSDQDCQFVIPLHGLVGIKPRGQVTLEYDGTTITIAQLGTTTAVQPIPASSYPRWRLVLPKQFSGKPAQYDLNLLAGVAKTAKLLNCKLPLLTPNDNSAGLVNFGDPDVFAVIMPIHPHWSYDLPDWLDLPAE